MRKGLIAASLGLLAAAVIVTSALAKSESAATPAQVAACTNVSLGFLGPLTGPAAFLGQEQISWLRFGAQKYNRASGTRFKVVAGDTQLKAPVARTVARRFVSNQNIMAVIGGSESQAVTVSGNLFEKAALVSVSGSATAVDLTKGRPFRTFFRVVPHDGIQGPQIVAYVAGNLKADNVVVIDSQDDYSLPLASGVSRGLRARNVNVERESVSADDTDFSSIVANVGNDVDVVVFATQVAPAANTLSQQLREQGKKAIVFGTDGAYSPSQFKPRSGYVVGLRAGPPLRSEGSRARPRVQPVLEEQGVRRLRPGDVHGRSRGDERDHQGLRRRYYDASRSRHAGASDEHPVDLRREVRFSAKGDPLPTRFVIYKISNGKYSPTG